jgi:hypothetical protein
MLIFGTQQKTAIAARAWPTASRRIPVFLLGEVPQVSRYLKIMREGKRLRKKPQPVVLI